MQADTRQKLPGMRLPSLFRYILACLLTAMACKALALDEIPPAGQAARQQQQEQQQDVETSVIARVDAEADTDGEEIEVKLRPSRAKSVPLDQPVIEQPAVAPGTAVAPLDDGEQKPAPDTVAIPPGKRDPLIILGAEVPPSTTTRLSWSPSQSMEGIATPTPVLIVHGANEGPVLCLTAAIHGDELNGIEIVRRVMYNLESSDLSGTVIGVPIVNLQGFHRSSRYLTDRRDLNRYFPGNPVGSSASRIAYSFFEEVIRHCDALVDLHTGSFHRTNMPQLRADLGAPQVVQLTQGFGATVVLHSEGATGTLRRAAVDAGIPAVTLEAGESMRLQERAVEHGVNGITTLMSKMGMIDRFNFWGDPEPVYHRSFWVRAEKGGILFSTVELGDRVARGDLLGEVTDPITNIKSGITSPNNGRVIGMALNQVVLPGFAAFHIAAAAPPALVTTGEDEERPGLPGSDSSSSVDLNGPIVEVPQEPDVMDMEDDLSGMSDGDDFD